MLAILNSLNAHNFPIFQRILMILVSKLMVYRALSNKTYLLLGLLFPLRVRLVPLNILKHMGQYQLLSVLAARLSPLNIDHSCNLPVEICGINYTEKYTNL